MKFEGRRSGTREARRILRKQVRNALKRLEGSDLTNSDIHAARKDVKKARATLRLLRDALPGAAYGRENDMLRGAARPLSGVRDTKVLVDTLDRLVDNHASADRIGGIRRLRRKLVHDSKVAHRRATAGAAGARHARRLLRKAQSRAARFSVGRHGWSKLGRGLLRLYNQGRDCLDEVRAEPTVERLHAWRKRTKYLYHQLQLLEPLCPQTLRRFAQQLHRLSDELGDDHDLAMLREQVAADAAPFPDERSRAALLTLIERSRTALQRRALLSGARLYRESPGQFESRLHEYWRRWLPDRR
jgi:CHAD domain-containing protein